MVIESLAQCRNQLDTETLLSSACKCKFFEYPRLPPYLLPKGVPYGAPQDKRSHWADFPEELRLQGCCDWLLGKLEKIYPHGEWPI